MMNRVMTMAGLGLAAMTGLWATAAQASLTLQIYNSIENTARTASSSSGGPLSLDHSLTLPDGRSYAGSGFVDYGVAKAFATATGSNFGQVTGETIAGWGDSITLTTPGVSSGFVTAAMALNADLLFGSGGFSFNVLDFQFIASQGLIGNRYFYQYNLNTSQTSTLTSTLSINDNGTSSVTSPTMPSPVMLEVEFRIPFISGQAFDIESSLTCSARGNLATSTCDAGSSAYWGGIRSVTDANGAALTGWTLASGSGTDWAQSFIPGSGAVPEPASWAMLIAGFGLVGAMRRRQRRQAMLPVVAG
jgi:hypothetical protein